jgi:hypothetical protein
MQVYYNPFLKDRLKVQFAGIDDVKQNYSNLNQDMFVLSVLNGKYHGTYLEIGGELPVVGNNTYLLESLYSWQGVSIELDSKFVPMWAAERKNPLYNQDALTTDYTKVLGENNLGPVIDYLSCDIEPQDKTLEALMKIDHDRYRFRVITFEHDHYNGGEGPRVREDSRKFLTSLGYEMLVGDVSHAGEMIEDWWVAPELVDHDIKNLLKLPSTWNADEAVYRFPVSAGLKDQKIFAAKKIDSLDQGYISLL